MRVQQETQKRAAKLLRMVAENKHSVDANYFWKITFAMEALASGDEAEAQIYLNSARSDVQGVKNAIEYYVKRLTGTNVETREQIAKRLEALRNSLQWISLDPQDAEPSEAERKHLGLTKN